jgi:hypothetical protein
MRTTITITTKDAFALAFGLLIGGLIYQACVNQNWSEPLEAFYWQSFLVAILHFTDGRKTK